MKHADEPTFEQLVAHELYAKAIQDYRRAEREAEAPDKQILAVGKIHPPMFNSRVKELHWVDEDGTPWLSYEELPCRTAQQAWSYIDGLALE